MRATASTLWCTGEVRNQRQSVCKKKQQILCQFFLPSQAGGIRTAAFIPARIYFVSCLLRLQMTSECFDEAHKSSLGERRHSEEELSSLVFFVFSESEPLKRLCSASRAAAERLFRKIFSTFYKKEMGKSSKSQWPGEENTNKVP